jgi:hypothetical protein
MLGLPLADSSCDNVDLAIPARRATSASDNPARVRSRARLAAMTLIGWVMVYLFVHLIERIVRLISLFVAFIIMAISFDMVKLYAYARIFQPELSD